MCCSCAPRFGIIVPTKKNINIKPTYGMPYARLVLCDCTPRALKMPAWLGIMPAIANVHAYDLIMRTMHYAQRKLICQIAQDNAIQKLMISIIIR